MNKIFKRWIVFVCLVLLIGVAGYLTLVHDKKVNNQTDNKLTIALVNEDVPTKFNNQNYVFGKQFVDLVSNDKQYNWQVISRAVADKAYADSSIDAIIYLPQSFSHDILTLQDMVPTKAKVDYKIQQQSSALSDRILQDKINTILSTFNENIVKMYYASVAGNIAEAQNNMGGALGKQETLVTTLYRDVNQPFKQTMPTFAQFISGTSSLQGVNESNVASQNNFTESTTNLLTITNDNFKETIPEVNDHFTLQKKIAGLNVNNANQGIFSQANKDQLFYRNQFLAMYQNVNNNFSLLRTGKKKGLFADLKKQVSKYNKRMTRIKGDMEQEASSLTTKRDDLLSLEKNLYKQFFNQDIDVKKDNFDQFTDLQKNKNAREGLSQNIKNSFGRKDYITNSSYSAKLAFDIGEISTNAKDYRLDQMVNNGSLSKEDKETYELKLQLIKQFASAYKYSAGVVDLQDMPTSNKPQVITKELQVTVPSGYTYISSKFPSFVKIKSVDKGVINQDNSIILDNKDWNDKTYIITFTITIDKNPEIFDIVWTNDATGEEVIRTKNTFDILPLDAFSSYLGKDKFSYITQKLGVINQVASEITLLYGSPDTDYTSLLDKKTKKEFEEASERSIFNRYGNMDADLIAERLDDGDVKRYKKNGVSNIKKVVDTITSLNQTIDTLEGTVKEISTNLPEDFFAKNITALNDWLQRSSDELNASYSGWKENKVDPLEVKDWTKYKDKDIALYEDNSDSLHTQIINLLTNTSKATESVKNGAQMVKDNSDLFSEMVNNAKETQAEAQKVLDNSDNLQIIGVRDVAASKDYFTNFSSVLSNTRRPDVDKNHLYDFFAKPIHVSDISPKERLVRKSSNDWQLILLFIAGIVTGAVLLYGTEKIIKRKK